MSNESKLEELQRRTEIVSNKGIQAMLNAKLACKNSQEVSDHARELVGRCQKI